MGRLSLAQQQCAGLAKPKMKVAAWLLYDFGRQSCSWVPLCFVMGVARCRKALDNDKDVLGSSRGHCLDFGQGMQFGYSKVDSC